MANYEIRSNGELTFEQENKLIYGYAAVFNKWSDTLCGKMNGQDIMFREMIMPGAFDGLIITQDVVGLYNHAEASGILARSVNGIGSMELKIDDYGLYYSFNAPDTNLGRDVLESLKRGDISSSSFAFIVEMGGEKWTKNADGSYNRVISKIGKLVDISLVVRPGYKDAVVSMRGLEQIEEITQQEKTEELQSYYKSLLKELE